MVELTIENSSWQFFNFGSVFLYKWFKLSGELRLAGQMAGNPAGILLVLTELPWCKGVAFGRISLN
jgi:hypothetical protein